MPNETWTIGRCMDWTRDFLNDKGDERSRLSAEWLLSGVTGLSRTELYMSFDKPMTKRELDAMHQGIVRRAKGEPLQYIVGETGFRMINVSCEPGVLIPRPETELLVEEVLSYLDTQVLQDGAPARERAVLPWNEGVEAAIQEELAARREEAAREAASETDHDEGTAGPETDEVAVGDGDAAEADEAVAADEPEAPRMARVLEVGCGTGCISLSLAYERAGRVTCIATDIEPQAVALASRNRDQLGLSSDVVDIREGNLVSPLDRDAEWGTFDVLVSNPPYIPTDVMATLPREVAHFEPALALDGGADGLDIFRRLVNAAPFMLRPGGLLACELYEGHLDAAAALCEAAGMRDVKVVDDLTGRPRIIEARVG